MDVYSCYIRAYISNLNSHTGRNPYTSAAWAAWASGSPWLLARASAIGPSIPWDPFIANTAAGLAYVNFTYQTRSPYSPPSMASWSSARTSSTPPLRPNSTASGSKLAKLNQNYIHFVHYLEI